MQQTGKQASRGRQGYGGIVELQARRDGHYYADAELNGSSIKVMVDTGASSVALTYEDAQRAGISVAEHEFTGRTQTANGEGRYAPVIINSVTIGSITVHNVQGVVLQRGKLAVTLLGMSFLGKLTRAEMSNGRLMLEN
jgi:aspartyl protease family protein